MSSPKTVRSDEETDPPRRRYDSPVRRQRAEETRERILTAGSELAHEFDSWNWDGLTFRAVAERAEVGERTVYRYFPTERHLHDAVMQRLNDEAGIDYESVDLDNFPAVAERIFATLQSFAVKGTGPEPDDPAFLEVDVRRREALHRALRDAAPQWDDQDRRAAAGLLDLLWTPTVYERLVRAWQLEPEHATATVQWLIDVVIGAVHGGEAPPRRR